MIGRRSLITAALGLAGSSLSGVKAGDMVKAASGIDATLPSGPYPMPTPVFEAGGPPAWWSASEQLRSALYEEQSKLERSMNCALPADIASKKSWSPVVKHSKAEKRLAEIRRAIRALDNENTAVAMLKKLGITI